MGADNLHTFEERNFCVQEKDVMTKEYFGDRSRFADLMNVFYFQGKAVIRPEDVERASKSREYREQLFKVFGI